MPRPELTPAQRTAGDKRGDILMLHARARELMDQLDSFRHPDPTVEGNVRDACRHVCDVLDSIDDALTLDAGTTPSLQTMTGRLDRHLIGAPTPVKHAFHVLAHAARRAPEEASR